MRGDDRWHPGDRPPPATAAHASPGGRHLWRMGRARRAAATGADLRGNSRPRAGWGRESDAVGRSKVGKNACNAWTRD